MTQAAPLATSSTNHPLPLPGGVTHFKLLKGGLRGTDCPWTSANGVATDKIPIENFDVDWITGTFGFDRDYRVQFFQNDPPGSGSWKAKGSYRKFGIEGEVAEGVTSVEGPDGGLVPRQAPPSSFESIMGVMMGMKQMAQDEQRVIVETVREQSQAQVVMARDAGQQNVMMMGTFMTKMMELNAPRSQGVDPALAAILASLAESNKTTNAMLGRLLEDEEPELDEEEEKALEREKRLKALTKTMREGGGIGSLLTFVKELAVDELIDYLPTLKEKFPQYIVPAMAQFQKMAVGMAAPPPPPPPPTMAVQPYAPPPAPRSRPKAPPPPPPEPATVYESELPTIT